MAALVELPCQIPLLYLPRLATMDPLFNHIPRRETPLADINVVATTASPSMTIFQQVHHHANSAAPFH